jgi:hypothetical protein
MNVGAGAYLILAKAIVAQRNAGFPYPDVNVTCTLNYGADSGDATVPNNGYEVVSMATVGTFGATTSLSVACNRSPIDGSDVDVLSTRIVAIRLSGVSEVSMP